jgi:hypothetical protein
MKLFIRVLMGLVVMVLLVGQSGAQVDVKVGGGLLVDQSRWGGHLSVDIPIGDTYPTYLSPYVELYRSTLAPGIHLNEIPVGANLLYKAPFSEQYGVVFFGIGGGMYLARGTSIPITDFSGNVIDTISNSASEPMITAGGGLLVDVSDSMGLFVQGRWFKAFTTGAKNEVTLHVGLSFKLGED